MINEVYAVWLQLAVGPASAAVRKLYSMYGSTEAIYREREYKDFDLNKTKSAKLLNKDVGEAERIVRLCRMRKISIVTPDSDHYPEKLHLMAKMPVALYCIGDTSLLVSPSAAIVGSRSASSHGCEVTYESAKAVSGCGTVVVSGMARGIDAAAHRGALDSGGKTVAVLGTAIDRPYPAENIPLYNTICRDGCVISEYYPGARTNRWDFVERNRIISGISCVTFVGECGYGSGALITARNSRDQGKPVYCLPMLPQYSYAGVISLAESGIPVLTHINDIPRVIAGEVPASATLTAIIEDNAKDSRPDLPPDGLKGRIIQLLKENGAISVNRIIALLSERSGKIMAEITALELEGTLTRLPGDRYVLK